MSAGGVQACFFLAYLLVSLPGGLISDRFPRRRLLATSALVDFAAVATVAFVVLQGHVYVAQVCVVAVIQGSSSAVYSAAQSPALVRIVGKERINSAQAMGQAREAFVGVLAGPPLGVLLFSISVSLPFTVDAASFLAVTIAALLLRTPLGPDPEDRPGVGTETWQQHFTAGLRFIWNWPTMRAVYILVALGNMLFSGLELLTIFLVKARGGGNSGVAEAMVLMGVGMLGGSLIAMPLLKVFSGRKMLPAASAVMAAGALVAAWVPKPFEVGLSLAFVVFAAMPMSVFLIGFESQRTPDELRGRAAAAGNALGQGLMWVGPLTAGLLSQALTPAKAMVGFAVLIGLVGLASLAPALKGLDEAATTID